MATFTPLWKKLWVQLRCDDYLWHQTSLPSLEGILRDQQIVPNRGQLPVTYDQSRNGYAWHLGAVSLYDFATSNEEHILEHECKWGSMLVGRPPAGVLICLQRNVLQADKVLLPREIANDDPRLDALPDEIRRGRMVIPAVEALYIGPIPASALRSFILTASDGCGGHRWHQVEPSTDAFSILSDKSHKWSIERKRLAEERLARGDFSEKFL